MSPAESRTPPAHPPGLAARLSRWIEPLLAAFGEARRPAESSRRNPARATDLLASALSEHEPVERITLLREALAAGERVQGASGDILVLEASLHLGEKLRARGEREEALAHFTRAVERSYRVADPVGRQRRAGVLTRLGILDQEAGHRARARARYEEALALGGDCDSSLLLGMLTQAAFNLGLLDTEAGDDEAASQRWEQAMALGGRTGDPSGWDPAAVAAFNLGFLHLRRGEPERARASLGEAGRIAGAAGTPLGRMAAAKAELALATMSEHDGLTGELEAAEHYARGLELGRACPLPEGRLAALQCALGLGERAERSGRLADAASGFREALALAAGCESAESLPYVVLGELRLGQVLGEAGDREQGEQWLESARRRGRAADDAWVRELAAQAACNRHRLLCGLGRWEEADALAGEAERDAVALGSGMGRALAAAAAYARAVGELHAGDGVRARGTLALVVEQGLASDTDAGLRVAIDASLMAGQLERREGANAAALAQFDATLARLAGRRGGDWEGQAAMAAVSAGHCLLALERPLEARDRYRAALERGRASGASTGRAAAANAALNLASLLAGEAARGERRALLEVAVALGRSSRTRLGEACVRTAERARAALEAGD